jgi:hypothetical protein
MQKLTEVELGRALRLLKHALPEGSAVRPAAPHELPIYMVDPGEAPPFKIRLMVEEEVRDPHFNPRADGEVPVVVVPGRRPKNLENLRRTTNGFIAFSGAVFLRAPGLYIDRTDLPAVFQPQHDRVGGDPYTDKASRITRTLLSSSRRRRWSTQELAAEAGVDASTVSRTVGVLRARQLVRDESSGQGRRSRIWVPEPEALLQDWTRSYSWTNNRQLRVAAPVGDPRRFMRRMRELLPGDRWALSLQAGASLIAPHAEFDVIHVYVETQSLEAYALGKDWEETQTGKLCLLAPYYHQSVWDGSRVIDGQTVVGTVQLVLDLWHYPVRGREQAEHLIETVLKPIWNRSDDHA